MCFGSDAPESPQLAKPPAPQEMLDVMDELTGTKTVTATDPVTGKKVRLIQQLPRSKEEQALYDEAGVLMDKAIGEMKRLYDYDPSQIVNYAPFVNTLNALNQERTEDMAKLTQIPDFTRYVDEFKGMQKTILDEEFARRGNELQEGLNRKGYGNSTGSAEMKAALAKEQSMANQKSNVDALTYAQQLEAQDLARRTQEYGLREATREGRLASARAEYGLQKEYAQSLENQRDKALQHQANLFQTGANIRGADTNKKMSTMAPNLALAEFTAKNNNALNYYNADVNRIKSQYDMDLAEHNSQPPSFGQMALGLGTTLGSAYLMGGGGLGGFGSSFFGGATGGAAANLLSNARQSAFGGRR